ncbi:MAG: hypothetical protein QE278_13270 [Limnobacter sp.]|nr:hypothetical protein [Limnobacter sp.]
MRFTSTTIKTTLSFTLLGLLAACQTTPDPMSPAEQAKIAPQVPPVVVLAPVEYHKLEKCEKPLGTLRVTESGVAEVPASRNAKSKAAKKAADDASTNSAWLATLTTEHNLPAPRPLVQWMALQSNCFKVLDLDASLIETNEKPGSKKFVKKARAVPADYTAIAKVDFTTQSTEQFQGVVGTFSPAVGTVQSPIKTMDASTQLVLNANRSKAELGAAVGKASNKDFSFAQLLDGASSVTTPSSLAVYESKPEGRLVAGAFVNSFNQMVKAAQDFQQKNVKSPKARRPAVKPTANSKINPAVNSAPPAYVPIYKRPAL